MTQENTKRAGELKSEGYVQLNPEPFVVVSEHGTMHYYRFDHPITKACVLISEFVV